jgi:hypothetical protein
VNATPLLFDIEDMVIARPFQRVAPVVVEATEDDVSGVAGIALFGELLDHLGLLQVANRRGLRPIGPGAIAAGSAIDRWWSCTWPVVTSSPMSRCSKTRRHSAFGAATRCPAIPDPDRA